MGGEWPTVQLGDVVQNFDSRRIPISKREREKRPGPYLYYGATGIMDYVDDYLFDGLYLLIAEDGSVERPDGKPFLQLVNGQFWVNNHAHVLRGDNDEDTKFVYYSLSTVAIRPYMSGSVQSKLSQRNLNRILIHYPRDPRDRRAIARILGTLDDKIELNRRINQTLEEMARAIFKSWFVDFDPVRAKVAVRREHPDWSNAQVSRAACPTLKPEISELFPDEFENSELGEIPQGWRVKPISELTDVVGGSTPKTDRAEYWEGGTHHWATPKDLSALSVPVLLDTERKITNAGLAQISSGLLPKGTVLLSSRAPIGYLAIAEVPIAINQGFIAMKPRRGISNMFLLRWAHAFHEEIVSHANGSTFLEVSKSSFRPIRTVAPPVPVMDAFDRVSQPLYRKVVENERESRTLAALRDTLLPKLISGELRVKDAEKFLKEKGL